VSALREILHKGSSREANITQGEVLYFPIVHEHKQYFNWFIVMYMEHYFWYYIFQGKI